jgi:hypothetical protein
MWEAGKLSLPTCSAVNCDEEVNENVQTNNTLPLTRMEPSLKRNRNLKFPITMRLMARL